MAALERPGWIACRGCRRVSAARRQRPDGHRPSTIGFEFCLLDRPLIIFHAPELIRTARINPERVRSIARRGARGFDRQDLVDAAGNARTRPHELSARAPASRVRDVSSRRVALTDRAVAVAYDLLALAQAPQWKAAESCMTDPYRRNRSWGGRRRYLPPALARTSGAETVAIVDPSADRPEHVASRFGVLAAIAIIATPSRTSTRRSSASLHQYHAPVTVDLRRPASMCSSKNRWRCRPPNATTMISRVRRLPGARAGSRPAAPVPRRRFAIRRMRSTRACWARSAHLTSAKAWSSGGLVKSAAMFVQPRSRRCPGGHRHPRGRSAPVVVRRRRAASAYWDDAAGGVEAGCGDARRDGGRYHRPRGVRAEHAISGNSCVIRGDAGTLEVGTTSTDSTVTLTPIHGTSSLSGRAVLPNQQPPGSLSDLFAWQMADFVRAVQIAHSSPAGIRIGGAPERRHPSSRATAAVSGLCFRSNRCSRTRRNCEGLMTTPLTNATVLVTGATGFIGGRLAERLVVEHGARVRAACAISVVPPASPASRSISSGRPLPAESMSIGRPRDRDYVLPLRARQRRSG